MLKELVKEQLHYRQARQGATVSSITIPESDLVDKVGHCANRVQCRLQAHHMRIENVKPFLLSKTFRDNHYSYDAKRKVIVQNLF